MKKIYFVRHGESESNAGIYASTPDVPLTEFGHKQAEIIAERIKHLSFDKLIASTYPRAIQTAEYIKEKTGKDVETYDFLIERIRPTEIRDLIKGTEEYITSERNHLEAFKKGEKYLDGESFYEMLERVKRTLDYICSLKEESFVVITHGLFLKVLMSYIVLGDLLTPELCFQFTDRLKTTNTGISYIRHDKKGWKVIVWNDHAHFAEY